MALEGLVGTLELKKYMADNTIFTVYNAFMNEYVKKDWDSRNVAKLWTYMIKTFVYKQPKKVRGRVLNNCLLLQDNGHSNKEIYDYVTNQQDFKDQIKLYRGLQ